MYCDLWSQYINVWKLFKGGKYSRVETIWGNTVSNCWLKTSFKIRLTLGINLDFFVLYFFCENFLCHDWFVLTLPYSFNRICFKRICKNVVKITHCAIGCKNGCISGRWMSECQKHCFLANAFSFAAYQSYYYTTEFLDRHAHSPATTVFSRDTANWAPYL